MKKFYTIRMEGKELYGKYYDVNKAIEEIKEWQKQPWHKRKTFHVMEVKEIIKGNTAYMPE